MEYCGLKYQGNSSHSKSKKKSVLKRRGPRKLTNFTRFWPILLNSARLMRVMHYDEFNAKLCVIMCAKTHILECRDVRIFFFFHHFEQFHEITQLCARTIFTSLNMYDTNNDIYRVSLDHCMELREHANGDKDIFSTERKMRKQRQKMKQIRERQYEREKAREKNNLFYFINTTLGKRGK